MTQPPDSKAKATPRFQLVDEIVRGDHSHLRKEHDEACAYLREYTSGKGWQHSETNSLVKNFEKEMSKRGTNQWPYKAKAIRQVTKEFLDGVVPHLPKSATLVPQSSCRAVRSNSCCPEAN